MFHCYFLMLKVMRVRRKILGWIQLILATFQPMPEEYADANIGEDEVLLLRDTLQVLPASVSTVDCMRNLSSS